MTKSFETLASVTLIYGNYGVVLFSFPYQLRGLSGILFDSREVSPFHIYCTSSTCYISCLLLKHINWLDFLDTFWSMGILISSIWAASSANMVSCLSLSVFDLWRRCWNDVGSKVSEDNSTWRLLLFENDRPGTPEKITKYKSISQGSKFAKDHWHKNNQ